jgi:predicted nucleic acid-binding protein
MIYVLDSNVALKWELPEEGWEQARRVRHDFVTNAIGLMAPDIYPVEIAHVLSRAERQNLVLPPFACVALGRYLGLLPTLHRSVDLLPRAQEISSRYRIGAYNCLYVALAEQQQCPLLTADLRLINALGRDFPYLMNLDSLP